MKPIVLVAHDAAPSRCFMRLKSALAEKAREVVLIVADGKPDTTTLAQLEDAVSGACVVLLGMSSRVDLAALEIAAGRTALKYGVPYGFYSDIPNCHNRGWFGDLRERAAFWFVPNETDAANLRDAGFGDIPVIVSGNPLREEDFFLRFSRDEVRERLKVAEDEKFILAPGGKSPAVNIGIWSALLDALHGFEDKFVVMLALHPGDRTPSALDSGNQKPLEIYGDLLKFVPGNVRVEFLPIEKDVFGATEAVAGADLVVEYGSSIGMTAGAQRVPCITVKTAVGAARNFATSKVDTTEAVECGGSREIDLTGDDAISGSIRDLLDEDLDDITVDQETVLPKPSKRGESVRLMVEHFTSFESD